MKNSISKTLLCGILASTFFIINCQKAPNRGVRAAKAGGGTEVAAKPTAVLLNGVECSEDFLNKYKTSRDLIVKLNATKLDNLDSAQKEALKKQAQEAGEKTDETIAEITKIKTDADGCFITDKNTKKQTASYSKVALRAEVDSALLTIKAKVGIESDQITKAEENRIERDKNRLSEGLELIVSKDLAAVLKAENKAGVVYFKKGFILKETADYDKDKKSKSTTLCEIRNLTSENEVAEGDKLKILNMAPAKAEAERKVYAVSMGQAGQVISFACFIADGKEKVMATEFRNAFGSHLLTQKQLDAQTNKDSAASIIAKAEYEKKDKAYDAAKSKADKATEVYDAKIKEIQEAKTKKDSALEKKLTDALGTYKEAKEKADAEFEVAKVERDEAKLTYEKFSK